jgi:hypothetical protein
MVTVAEKLLYEIERIAAKRERWRGYAKMGPSGAIGFGLAIGVMTQEIEAAKRALMNNDALECIACLKSLEEYSDDD